MKKIAAYLVLVCLSALLPVYGQAGAAKKATEVKKEAVKKADAAKPGLIDINAASEDELKSIKGIGDVYAGKIVAGRPYKAKNELVSKKVLPQGVYDKVKAQIIAKQDSTKK